MSQTSTPGQKISDSDFLVLLGLAAFVGPGLALSMIRGLRESVTSWAIKHHVLTPTGYVIGVPGTGMGLDGGHLLIVLGVLGMCGLAGALFGRALLPRRQEI